MTTETAPAAVEAAAPAAVPETSESRALAMLKAAREAREAKPEAAPEVKPETPEPPKEEAKADPMERSFSALAKSTEKLRKEREAFEADRAGQKTRDERAAAYDALEAAAKDDPLAVLDKLGIGFEGLADRVLTSGLPKKDQPKSEVEQLKATVNSLLEQQKAKEEAERKSKEESAQQEEAALYARAQTSLAGKLSELSAKDARFEMVGAALKARGEEPAKLVLTLMQTHHQQTGEMMAIEEAAAMAESHYEEEATREYLPFLTTSKLRAKVSGVASPQPPASRPRDESGQRSPSTLTNSQAAVSPAPQATLSQAEREKLALQRLRAATG